MRGLYTIVGMKHRGMTVFVAGLPKNEPLALVREPDNKFDPNAVQVWARGRHIGFVKGTQSRDLAGWINIRGSLNVDQALPAQLCVYGRLAVTAERWPCAEIVEDAPEPEPPAGPTITEGREVEL
jgi:hypothetical protein